MEGGKKCGACGAIVGSGQFCEKCGADLAAVSFERDKARLLFSGAVRSAKSSLLWVGGLGLIQALLYFLATGGSDLVGGFITVFVAASFIGLWRWADQHPLGATATGLGVYLTFLVAGALMDPSSLFKSIIFKVIILALLSRGLRAAVALRSHGVGAL
jgi:hypothetical protein